MSEDNNNNNNIDNIDIDNNNNNNENSNNNNNVKEEENNLASKENNNNNDELVDEMVSIQINEEIRVEEKEEKEVKEVKEEKVVEEGEEIKIEDNEDNKKDDKTELRQSMWIGSQPKKDAARISPLNLRGSNNSSENLSTSGNEINNTALNKSSSSENISCNNSSLPTTPTPSSAQSAASGFSSWWNGLIGKKTATAPSTTSTSTTSTTSTTIVSNNDEVEDQIFTHSSIDSATTIVREGYLNKQGHLRKNWLCRYFILTETSLEYYKDKGSQFLNRIPLSECTIQMAEIEIKKSLCFKITHLPTKRPFYLFSNERTNTTEYERDSYEWIGSVQEVIDKQQNLLKASTVDSLDSSASIVTETHKNYELVHCMSHALLFSLGKISAAPMSDLCMEDFQASETFNVNKEVSLPCTPLSTSPSVSGSAIPNMTTTSTSASIKSQFSYKFTDYSPKVFRKIRELCKVNSADYMLSLAQNTLTEEPTQGKSNSLFYFTSDKKLLIKTITTTEFEHLKSLLPNYYFHLLQNPDSLIVKFYGLHYISPSKMKNTFFVVMDNIFGDHQMDEIYDLKGSTLQRKAEEGKRVLMDLDFSSRIFISEDMKNKFFKQIENDCNFLEKNSSMDYSLLLGIHYLKGKKINDEDIDDQQPFFKKEMGGILSRTASGDLYDRVYYLGIIDILTVYNIKKQIEHTYKSVAYDTIDSMSAVDPTTYSKRFKNFIQKITGWHNKTQQ
ncbi:hypothetical protein DICPUDRAFT_52460 [Dictyostelium purpureum]|uniref:Uncharacterized protein n=1 Tax=Dictyostelium purpureum TaxID=5786 RepID=F0Z8E7_DICPU|nr:uncharacterized protein DICPUDRAFT_52460 [Dictyostelium purpureum]EGC39800.1 hypothetical protein DICPUDRAFT_52460 [Dictyostelium purpureum]|eukprot:XP_003283667.1 hypothetical protein DICPUDRAFT_52460 [Dictyostelium purpureum]